MALQGSHDMIFLRFVCRFVQREKVLLNVAIVHRMEKKVKIIYLSIFKVIETKIMIP